MKILLLTGTHPTIPGARFKAFATRAKAEEAARLMVDIIREDAPRDGADSDEATPHLKPLRANVDWQKGLLEAQRCIASFRTKISLDQITREPGRLAALSGTNVELLELEVTDGPAALLNDTLEAMTAIDALDRAAESYASLYGSVAPRVPVFREKSRQARRLANRIVDEASTGRPFPLRSCVQGATGARGTVVGYDGDEVLVHFPSSAATVPVDPRTLFLVI